MGFLRRLFSPLPLFDWVQIGVTSRCNARCLYCPRGSAGASWVDADLDFDLFRILLPQLSTHHVHLQGWGEPFLHPRLLDMVRAAKAGDLKTGTTSNGVLIDADMAEAIVGSGLDILALSLAGVAARHDAARRGAPFAAAMAAMEALAGAKARGRRAKPAVHVAYMLLRSDISDLEALPALLAGRGVAQVVVSTLDYLPDPELADEAFFPMTSAEHEAFCARIGRAAEAFKKAGIVLHCRPPSPERLPGCPENPARALVVDAQGRVSPCVYTALPIEKTHPGGAGRVSFGRVGKASLAGIWKNPDYVAFRDAFSGGLPEGPCLACRKPYLY
jgi:MoaA/NifB/PqqE/SkfB family radical SAM enzyme